MAMKHITILLLLTAVTAAPAQISYGRWKVNEQSLVTWESVYNDSASIQELTTHLRSYSWIRELTIDGDRIFAIVENHVFPQDLFAYADPVYEALWNWSIMIEKKSTRYKVTIGSIYFRSCKQEGQISEFKENGTFEELVLRRDRSGFREGRTRDLETFSNYLKRSFQCISNRNNDW
jgi:hypothetical protein